MLNKAWLSLPGTSSVLILVILIVASSTLSTHSEFMNDYYVFGSPQLQLQPQQQQQNTGLSLSTLASQGSPLLGDPTAPVTIIDFSDFQCYLCARYVKATEPLINQTYIQSGKVALVFKHLPNRGSDSFGASLAAQCVNDQGKFWQFHQLLYKNQKPIDSGWVSNDNLKKLASQITGLDIQQFEECFKNGKYKDFVEKDLALASSLGFQDTPSFLIVNSKDGSNPQVLKGAHPFLSFKTIIDNKLKD
ncbi:MAG: DsbA family protein [Thermoproteota archaeon]|nr:DsbA family protein [Thermoproteota archaeon]